MKTIPLRRAASILNGGTPTPAEDNWQGAVEWATPVDLARYDGGILGPTDRKLTLRGLSTGSTLAPKGAVLMSTRAPIGYTALLETPTAFNQGCKAVVPGMSTDPRFLQFSLISQSAVLKAAGSGSTFLELSNEALASCNIPRLELAAQRQIADFLDDRVARIDQIIAARQQQQDLLRETHQATLEGLMDASDRVRAGRVLRVLPGYAFPSEGFSTDPSSVPLLRGINVAPDGLRWEETVYWPEEEAASVSAFRLEAGDLVMGMDRPWVGSGLRIAEVREEDRRPLLLQRVAKITPLEGSQRFIYWAYRSSAFRAQVEATLTGLSVPHLSGEQIASYDMPWPSDVRQQQIAAELDASAIKTAAAESSIQAAIDLLREYKQSLITAAVTGEFDVTTASTRIPE